VFVQRICSDANGRPRRKVVLGFFLLGLCWSVNGSPQLVRRVVPSGGEPGIEGRRVALVIGNAAYQGQPALKNPENDARDIGRVLEDKLKFQAEVVVNTDLRSLGESVDRFIGKLQPGDIGLFYFSGHGMQVGGENYLVPVNFNARYEADVKYEAYAASRVRDLMKERGARLSILILDACRDDPYRSLRSTAGGLAGMSGEGAFIAFAADEGKTANDNPAERNGLFTKHLLEVVQKPGLELSEVFNQVRSRVYQESKGTQTPFSYSGVIGDFYFSPVSADVKPIISAGDGPQRQPVITVTQRYGSLEITSDESGALFLDGTKLVDIQAYAAVKASDIPAGAHTVALQTASGRMEKPVRVLPDETAKLDFQTAPGGLARFLPPLPPIETTKVDSHLFTAAIAAMAAPSTPLPDSESPEQLYQRGVNLAEGKGVPQNDQEAVKYFRLAAERNYSRAQNYLGLFYADGRGGLPKDDVQAAAWYRKAADQGSAHAQSALGVFYANGRGGLPKDDAQAVAWYRKAADQGNPDAQNHLGYMYAHGLGLPKDDAQAVAWYRKAAAQGNARGETNLGYMYETGRGLTKDLDQAITLYKAAAANGDVAASGALKRLGIQP
jgi:TPR repeat protein